MVEQKSEFHFLQKPFPLFYFVHIFSRFDIEFHFHEVGKVTDVWISQKYGFAYVEMEDQKWVSVLHFSKSFSNSYRTALKAVKELNGSFMCGGTVTVGNLCHSSIYFCPSRLKWLKETTKRGGRESWTCKWDGARKRKPITGTTEPTGTGTGVEAGVKRGHQDCMNLEQNIKPNILAILFHLYFLRRAPMGLKITILCKFENYGLFTGNHMGVLKFVSILESF